MRDRVGGMSLPWVMDYSPSPISIERGRVDGVCLPQGIQDRRPTGKTCGRLETADRPAKRAAGRDKRNRLIRSTGRETESLYSVFRRQSGGAERNALGILLDAFPFGSHPLLKARGASARRLLYLSEWPARPHQRVT